MFDPGLVLGVDPGIASVGLALVRAGAGSGGAPTVSWATTVRTRAGGELALRLRRVYREVLEVIRVQRPGAVALERLMWGRNAPSGMEVARASGVIVLAAAEAEGRGQENAPAEVKMALTGVGDAPKDVVRRGVVRLIGVDGVPVDPDAADAVAEAVCHLQQARLRGLTSEAVP